MPEGSNPRRGQRADASTTEPSRREDEAPAADASGYAASGEPSELARCARDFRSLAEHSPDVILRFDRDLRCTYASPAIERYFGRPASHVLGMTNAESGLPRELAERFDATMRRVLATGEPAEDSFEIAGPDGARHQHTRIVPELGEDGAVESVLAVSRDITAIRQAEAQLRESESRYERIATNVPGVVYQYVYRTDGSRGFTYASEGARSLFGVAPEAMIRDAAALFDLVHPEDRPSLHASGAAAVAALAPWRWEGRLVLPTGEERWVQVASRNAKQPDGSIHADGILMDVTELRRTEAALRRREREFAALTENSPDVIARLDRSCRFRYVNAAVEQATGIPPAAWLGRTHAELGMPAEFVAMWRDGVERVIETRQPEELEFEFATPTGPRWYECRLVPEPGADADDDSVASVLAIGRDVTEHRRAVEALRRRESHFRSLSVSSPLGVFHSDADGNVTYANPRLQKIWGANAKDMLGRGWLARVHPDDARQLLESWRAALRGEREFEHEYRLAMDDGSIRWVRGRSAPLRDAEGMMIGTVGTIEDITSHRALEEQLRQSQKMEAVGQLAGGVAHDFNNLLTVIKVHGEMALEELDASHPLHADILEIKRAATRAAALTRQLLAFSRKQLLQPRLIGLEDVVRGVEPMLRRLIGEDIRIETRLTSAPGRVLADPGQLEQVLVNLAVNARDAMPDGGSLRIETAAVHLSARDPERPPTVEPGSYLTLTVTDTGIGMTREVHERIFEPFFTTKAVGKGTGLGLPTVYGIVQQSGGHIEVRSAPGRGAAFTIYLPESSGGRPRPNARSAESRPRGSETVLLVEDEASVRRIARRVLERQGYTVIEAEDGERALALAAAHQGAIDLLLTDLVMPGLSGRALAERLVAERTGLRVLYVSGYTDDEIVRRGLLDAEGARMHFLEKPFTADTLAPAVRAALDGQRVGRG